MKAGLCFGFVLAALSAAGDVIRKKPSESAEFKCDVGDFTDLIWRRGIDLIFHRNERTGHTRKGQIDIVKRSRCPLTNLLVSGVKEEDAGSISCTVDKKKVKEYTLLVVSVSSSPSGNLMLGTTASLQCRVKGLQPGSRVQWKRPDGSHTESETVQLEPVASSHEGTWQCCYTHDSMPYTESLEVKVQMPPTKAAATLPSEKSKEVTKAPCTNCVTPASSNIGVLPNMWIWILAGVGGFVVLLLLVLMIVLCQRIKRRKRRRQRKLNSHHSSEPMKPRQFCQCNRPTAAAKPQQGRRKEKPLTLPRQPLLME